MTTSYRNFAHPRRGSLFEFLSLRKNENNGGRFGFYGGCNVSWRTLQTSGVFNNIGEKAMTDEKREYYIKQFEKIYHMVKTDREFINMVEDLIEQNIEIEMARCPFQLTKKQADEFRIHLFNMDAAEFNDLINQWLRGY
ncbi:hypothetical protein C7J86_22130 [Salmonella enterica]|nr:hypothetical protein [Salmonella enterica]EFS0379734.1 hypothetical protein [Salmonella enterica]